MDPVLTIIFAEQIKGITLVGTSGDHHVALTMVD